MLDSNTIEKQIKEYSLTFIQTRNRRIEWEMKLPMFVNTFNRFIAKHFRIPSQEEFIDEYMSENESELASVLVDPELQNGLEARLRRTYPSLVRDVHLTALFREHGLQVSYDQETDIRKGVDHIIINKGKTFNIHCYVNTARGRHGRKIKNKRHDFKGIHLDLELKIGAPSIRKIGDFYLYSDRDVIDIISKMEDHIIQDK